MASLGIYIFRPSVLRELLESSDAEDFGRQVIPMAITRYKVMSFPFLGYWQDIGTIPSFYRANLDLTAPLPRLNLYDEEWPFFTYLCSLPPPKLDKTSLDSSLVGDGAIISGSEIQRSVVGLRSIIREGCLIRDSIVMGYDNYEVEGLPFSDDDRPLSGIPPFGVGRGCRIEGAILDKRVRADEGVVICGRPGSGITRDESDYCVRDGIVIIPRGQILRAGTEILV
jgi:glucose-1-phosphate adenylyltransferase